MTAWWRTTESERADAIELAFHAAFAAPTSAAATVPEIDVMLAPDVTQRVPGQQLRKAHGNAAKEHGAILLRAMLTCIKTPRLL
jgi:hypothetical protein